VAIDLELPLSPGGDGGVSVFIADHSGLITTVSEFLRPVHIGAALADAGSIGPEPDTTVPNSLSSHPVFADLRLYDYISKTYAGRCDLVCIQQYRRWFFLHEPESHPRNLSALERVMSNEDGGLVGIAHRERDLYLEYLADLTDETLRRELGDDTFVANRLSFEVNLEDQYLISTSDLFPDQPEYIDAWHDMRAALGDQAGAEIVETALSANSGFFNNCFIATWEEFERYRIFLFDILEELDDYRDVFRLYGYLAERIFSVYVTLQALERPEFGIRSKPLMVAGR
jgi:hypothetical protein